MAKKQEKPTKVWYLVSNKANTKDIEHEFTACRETLEEAFTDEIQYEVEGKKYAFKIELLGEIETKLTIKK